MAETNAQVHQNLEIKVGRRSGGDAFVIAELGLSSTLPANDGTNVTEPSGNNYARISMAGSGADWEATAGLTTIRQILTITVKAFPQSSGAWLSGAQMPYLTAYNSAGTLIDWVALGSPATVAAANVVLQFNAGSLACTG